MSETDPVIARPVEDLQQLREVKRAELDAVENELATARWLADYDSASLYGKEHK